MDHIPPPHSRASSSARRGRRTVARQAVSAVLSVALVAMAFLVLDAPQPAAADGTPDVGLSVEAPEEVLYGDTATVSATASNDTDTWGYNLSFREVLPPGISYVPGSSNGEDPAIIPNQPATGETTLLWVNFADLAPDNSFTLTYDVAHLTSTLPGVDCAGATLCVGETYTHSVGAYVNDDPRFVPDFDALTGVPVTGPASHTGWAEASDSTLLVPFDVQKDEPNAEGEILRGLHEHATTYTVTVTNNSVNPTHAVVVDDWIPAGLELLGCGGIDNTTDAPTNPGSPLEYPGAAPLTATATPTDCVMPTLVATEDVDPDGSGPLPQDVYTHVRWTGLDDLAPGEELVLRYAVGIPIRENTLSWSGAEPATTGAQAANLDNNSGPETTDEQELTNHAAATGTYQGAVFGSGSATSTDTDDLTRTAEDLSIHKTGSTEDIEQEAVVSWDLLVETSEYRRLDDIVVTETLPNGLCPLAPGTDFDTTEPSGRDECNADVLPGTPGPSTPYSTTTPPVENADGTWTVTFDGSSTPELAAMTASGSFTVTLPTHTRQSYQADGEDTTPVVGRDGWTNEVAIEGTAGIICGNGDVSCTEGEPRIDADRPDGESIPDESGAGQEAPSPEIVKYIGEPDADDECDADVDWGSEDALSFALGDQVCYRLTVEFSPHLHTRDATVGDFLPPNTTYVAGSAEALPGNTVDIVAGDPVLDSPLLTWRLGTDAGGDACDPESEDCYVNPGESFDVAFAVIANDDPANGNAFDLVENLMKFSGANTGGVVVPLRDDVTFEVAAPILSIAKSNDATTARRQADEVDYTVTVTNSGNEPALDVQVWDILPPEVACADVSAITAAGSCTVTAGRDRIGWTLPGPIAPGGSASVTYTVTMPDGDTVSAPVAAGDTLTNGAGVRRYETETNLDGRIIYIPSSNVDETEEDDANVGPVEDTSSVDIVDATVTKAVASLTSQGGNDAGAQATIGETVRYTVTMTVPAGTSVYDGALTDTVSNRHTYVDGTAEITFPDGSTYDDGGGGDPLPTGFAWTDVALSLPDEYHNAVGSGDDVFTLVFDATIDDEVANTRIATGIPNTAALTGDDSIGDSVPTVTSNQTTVPVVEPLVSVAKTNGGGPIAGGDVVHYTVTVTNSSAANVSTANDLVIVDELPEGLTTVTPTGITGGGTFSAGPPQTITWEVPILAPGGTATLEYDVLIDDAVVAGTTYTNEVTVESTSMPPGDPQDEEREYSVENHSDIGVVDPPFTKTVDPATRTIGELATYTIDLTIPANVELFDATVVDTLDDGLLFNGFGTCSDAGAGLCAAMDELGPDADSPAAGQTRVGWDFGDITTSSTPRPVTLTYTAIVGDTYEDDSDVVAGDTLDNAAALHWNTADDVTEPPTEVPDPTDFDERTPGTPAVATVTVVEPDLAIDKDVAGQAGDSDTRSADVDETLTYTVVATNATGATVSPAHDLVVVDTLPDELVLDESSISHGGTWDGVARTITWELPGPFAPGASTPTLTYQGTVGDSAEMTDATTLVNTAEIGSYFGVSEEDREAEPDRAYREYEGPSDVVTVNPEFPELVVTKSSTGDPVVGVPFPWTITVENGSDVADAFDVDVIDTLPAAWDYQAGSAQLSIDGGPAAPLADPVEAGAELSWTDVADLPPGSSFVITFTATPLRAARDNATNINAVTVTGDDADGNDHNDDADYTDDDTEEVTLTGASIGDRTWEDLDGDGAQEGGEPGIEGVEVTLYEADGTTVIDTTTTDADGDYLFDLLPAGDYVVGFGTPSGLTPTPAGQGGNGATDSDASVTTGLSPVVTLAAGEANRTVDAGYYELVSLGDLVWEDVDGDGIQDGDEPGLEDVTVTLYAADGTTVIDTTTTDADGGYLFEDLPPGSYVVAFTVPAGRTVTTIDAGSDDAVDSDADRTTGRVEVDLVSGEDDLTIDAGLYTAGALGDRVWFDLDGDGIQEAGEAGAPGVTVELLSSGGAVLDTTTTDADGAYLFTGLAPGSYSVRFTAPAGTDLTATDAGGDDGTDSDAGSDGETGTVTISSGEEDRSVDAGLVGTGSLGDRVWDDLDGDGTQDSGEPGIEGATVALAWAGPDGTFGTADDGDLGTRTTDADGEYLFEDLPPGDYVVTFTTPSGLTPTAADQGGDDADSDADATTGETGVVTLAAGEDDLTVDAGSDGETGTVTISSGEEDRSVDAGLVGTGSLGDRVWDDLDGDGTQDSGEPGIEGATVALAWAGPDGTFGTADDGDLGTRTTDADGEYLFEDLPPGDYVVTFTTPSGLTPTAADQGGDDADSDADATTGETGVVTLAAGEDDLTVDAGYYELVSLGDFVWEDVDGDGTQDAGEPGVEGVTVTLYGPDGTTVIDTTTTDADGAYLFTELVPGGYVVGFTPPTGLLITTADAGTDDLDSDADPVTGLTGLLALVSGEDDLTVDAGLYTAAGLGDRVWFDLDGDGIQDAGEAGAPGVTVELLSSGGAVLDTTTTASDGSYLFTDLPPGSYSVRFTAPDGTVFTTADAGGDEATDSDADATTGETAAVTIISGQEERRVDAGLVGTGSLGDRVWDDLDGDGTQDSGEPGIEGATVALTWAGPDGDFGTADDGDLGTTTTDADGAYLFDGLPPGDFVVTFTTPAGLTPVPADAGSDDAADSDADPTTGESGVVTLDPGEEDLTVDAGFYAVVALGDLVWEDVDGDGVQDAGEPGVADVTVTLYAADGTTVIDTTTTDADGAYLFEGLVPGDYVVGFEPPAGLLLSPVQDAGSDDAVDSDADPTSGLTATIALMSGEDDLSVDAAVYSAAALGDRVWFDLDGDGIQGSGEPSAPGVTVELLSSGGTVLDTATTDADGEYLFEDLPPGTYSVRFAAPAGTAFTPAGEGGDGALDSDPDPTTGETGPVAIVSGQEDLRVDAGLIGTGSLGDFVWEDLNGDGVQDAGEPGIEGAVLTLTWAGPDGVFSTDDDGDLGTTTTDADGAYLFDELPPGEYRATVTTVPGGLIPTDDLDGVETASTAIATLEPGADRTDVDFGYRQEADLVLGKIVDDDTLDATDTAVFRITVGNDGPNPAEGPIVVTDTLPAGLTAVSAIGTGWTCSIAGQVVSCEAVGPLANGATLDEIVVSATVDATAETTLVNTATVAAATYETDESDNTDTATVTARHIADLVIDKSHAADAFVVGQEGTYTLAVANQGPSPSVGTSGAPIVVTDTLPEGLTPVTATGTDWTCAIVDQTVTCQYVGTVPAGSSLPAISITVAVDPAAEGGVTNTATVTPGVTHDPVDPNNTDEDPTDITPSADLSLVKTSGGSFVVGAQGTFTFTVHNAGPSVASSPITVTDTLPTGLTYASSASTDGWTCAAVGQDVTCTLDETFAVDRTSVVTITVDVDAAVDPDVINTATVTSPTLDPDPDNNTSGTEDPSTPTVDLVIDKHHTGDMLVGATGTYLLDVANNGPSVSDGVITVTDTLPTGLTPTAASGTDWACTIADQDVTCTVDATVGPGGSFPVISVEVDVLPGAYPSVVNTATVAPPPGVNEVVTENNTDDDPTTVLPLSDLELTKTHTGTFLVGQPGTYQLTVTNHGPTPTPGPLTIVDALPVGLSFASAAGEDWTCSAVGLEVTCTYAGPALAVDDSTTVEITVDVGTAAEGTVTNTATVTGPAADEVPENNTDDDETTVDPVANLSVTKTHTGDFLVGQPAEWVIDVANGGPSTARGPITVTDTVPDHVEVTGAAGDGWTCDIAGQDVTCTRVDDLPVGPAPTITLLVVPRPGSEGEVVNTATVTGPTLDPVPEDDTDDDPATVVASVDLSVEKALVDDDLVAGGDATWRIAVSNAGPSAAVDVVVVDTLPAGLTYAGASGNGWACAAEEQTVTCELGSPLEAGATSTIDIETTVDAAVGSDLSNRAEVSSNGADLDDGDNATATSPVAVEAPPTNPPGPTPPSSGGGGTGGNGTLPRTGADAMRLAGLGLVLTLGGAAIVFLRRRRRPLTV